MEKKIDLRINKTYQALTEAFWQLLAEKRFEDVSVKELCDHAVIRRATFYKHFADKNEFFAFIIREKQAEFDAQIRYDPEDMHPQSFYLDIIQHTLDFLKANEKLVQTMLESKMLPTVLDILSRQITLDIAQKIKENAQNGIALPASPQVMAHFYTGALMYTIRWWVSQKTISEAELMEEISNIMPGM